MPSKPKKFANSWDFNFYAMSKIAAYENLSRLIFIIGLLGSVIFLAGCFGSSDKDIPQTNTAVRPSAQEEERPKNIPPATPSFQDGDLYVQALTDKDKKICTQIVNQQLKTRCIVDAE